MEKMLYKNYANQLTKLKVLSKKMFYQNQFSEVCNSPRETWNLINSMLYNKKCL